MFDKTTIKQIFIRIYIQHLHSKRNKRSGKICRFRDLQEIGVHEQSSTIMRLREDFRICQTELRFVAQLWTINRLKR